MSRYRELEINYKRQQFGRSFDRKRGSFDYIQYHFFHMWLTLLHYIFMILCF